MRRAESKGELLVVFLRYSKENSMAIVKEFEAQQIISIEQLPKTFLYHSIFTTEQSYEIFFLLETCVFVNLSR